jgi:hypothetical protein
MLYAFYLYRLKEVDMKKIMILFFVFFVVLAFYGSSPAVYTSNHYASGFDENGLMIADDTTNTPAPAPDNKPIVNREDPFAIFGQNEE